jgi:hypothetical protein
MKQDPILNAISSFLIPVIFLYGLFILSEFFQKGFLAVIYAIIFFIGGLMIYLVRLPNSKILEAINFEYISFFLLLISLSYLSGLFILISN